MYKQQSKKAIVRAVDKFVLEFTVSFNSSCLQLVFTVRVHSCSRHDDCAHAPGATIMPTQPMRRHTTIVFTRIALVHQLMGFFVEVIRKTHRFSTSWFTLRSGEGLKNK